MDIESLKGKKINDIITEETEVVQISDHIAEEIGEGLQLPDKFSVQEYRDLAVIADYHNELIVCFKGDKAVAIFYVYEPRYICLYGKRDLLVATGNGNTHLYWFDNGEYTKDWY